MATIIELRLPAEDVTLGQGIAAVPAVTIAIEQFASDGDPNRPLVWIEADDFTAVEEALACNSTVADYSLVGDVDGRQLYEIAWSDSAESTLGALERFGAHLRRAELNGGEWTVELLVPTREQLSEMYDFSTERGLSMTVDSIYEMNGEGAARELTDDQLDALETALDTGYYEVPRDASMTDVAGELDVSHQALSERLRRAHGRLVADALDGRSTSAMPERDQGTNTDTDFS